LWRWCEGECGGGGIPRAPSEARRCPAERKIRPGGNPFGFVLLCRTSLRAG